MNYWPCRICRDFTRHRVHIGDLIDVGLVDGLLPDGLVPLCRRRACRVQALGPVNAEKESAAYLREES